MMGNTGRLVPTHSPRFSRRLFLAAVAMPLLLAVTDSAPAVERTTETVSDPCECYRPKPPPCPVCPPPLGCGCYRRKCPPPPSRRCCTTDDCYQRKCAPGQLCSPALCCQEEGFSLWTFWAKAGWLPRNP